MLARLVTFQPTYKPCAHDLDGVIGEVEVDCDLTWPFRSVLKSVKRTNIAALGKYLSSDQIKETEAAKEFYSYDESPHPINLWVTFMSQMSHFGVTLDGKL